MQTLYINCSYTLFRAIQRELFFGKRTSSFFFDFKLLGDRASSGSASVNRWWSRLRERCLQWWPRCLRPRGTHVLGGDTRPALSGVLLETPRELPGVFNGIMASSSLSCRIAFNEGSNPGRSYSSDLRATALELLLPKLIHYCYY
jgi:hypothetical protein